jgi:twitching motility protein PilU
MENDSEKLKYSMATPIDKYLTLLAQKDGSDLYLSTGAPPCAKFQGVLKPLSQTAYKPGEILEIANALMDVQQREVFEHELEMNLAVSMAGVGRFRVNIFRQRNQASIVVRNIKADIPKFEDLGLPEILKDVIMIKRGLVLFVGGTGSGKSTSLASLIDHRNSTSAGHIITIEDPVEYIHKHKKSIINQREVGVDTRSFHAALKNTLRQAPDVILIGEIRDRATMEHALEFAETGHLAISTLHANNANQALERIINMFPEDRQAQLLLALSQNMRAIVSQRLVPTVDNKRCAAVEVLLGTKTIQDMIFKNRLLDIKPIMEKSENLGMRTFDAALFELYRTNRISYDDAVSNSDAPNNLRLRIKLADAEPPMVTEPVPAAAPTPAPSHSSELSLEALDDARDNPGQAQNDIFRPK